MIRSRCPDSAAYEILGVSPDSSAKEIESAFHSLMDDGSYRFGVPPQEQENRARQIEEAYAALTNAASSRAYDDSRTEAFAPALWPATGSDAGAGEAVEPAKDPQAEQPVAQSAEDTFRDNINDPSQPVPIKTAVLSEILMASSEGGPEPREAGEQAAVPAAENVSGIERPTIKPFGSGNAEAFSTPDGRFAGREEIGTDAEDTHDRRKSLAIAAAVAAVGLSSLALFLSWPSGEPRLPTGTAPRAHLADPATPGPGQPGQVAGSLPEGGAASPERAAQADSTSSPDTMNELFGGRAAEATVVPPQFVPSAVDEQVQRSAAESAEGAPETAASAPPQPQAQTSPAPPALPQPQSAPAPSGSQVARSIAPSVAPATARAAVASPPASGAIRVPAQWLSGGPTKADNRRGRYNGTVVVQYTVQANGRVSGCVTARGSGNPDLDAITCRIVEERSRFKPALDAQNRPVASQAHAIYVWSRGHHRAARDSGN